MYESSISEFIESRIEETTQQLLHTNSEYAIAAEKGGELLENVYPVIYSNHVITLAPQDCEDIQEFLEQEEEKNCIAQRQLYRQGYLDCIKLLKQLGVLA